MTDPGSIQTGLDSIVNFILKYAVTLAALAALTVGLLEAYKKLFNTLALFHQKALMRWLAEEAPTQPAGISMLSSLKPGGHYGVAPAAKTGHAAKSTPYDASTAYAEMLHLTTGVRIGSTTSPGSGDSNSITRNVSFALFELELAKMMSQIQEAADAALNNPTRYEQWFSFVTRGSDEDDVRLWVDAMTSGQPLSANPSSSNSPRRDEVAEVYARIRLLMRRQLDSFQTITSYRWKEWNQLWAWLVGGVLLMLAQLIPALRALPEGTDLKPMNIAIMGAVSLAGGLLAPIAKDLVDALSKVKSGG